MHQYLDKTCKVHINVGGKDLFYTAKIIGVNDTHIVFIDKFEDTFTFRIADIVEIRG